LRLDESGSGIFHQGLTDFRVSTRLCGCFGMEVYCAADATVAVDAEAKSAERKDRRRYPRVKANVSVEAAAGIRTFAIAGVLGAACFQLGGAVLVAVGILALAGFIALFYLRTHQEDPGLTTESALLLTLVLGALAMGEPALASAVAVVVAILLAARISLHRFVRTVLMEQELHDALILAAAIVVVLPLIPNRYMGAFGALNPRTIWKIVVLMMLVSAAGYVAVRAIGPRLGLPLAGFASGFASSAAGGDSQGQGNSYDS
jgi:hypothetical protein